MAVGNAFTYHMGGSTVTAGVNDHRLFGAYSGLSLLNQNDTIWVRAAASTGIALVSSSPGNAGNDGLMVAPSQLVDLPLMRVGEASGLALVRVGANNPVVYWSVWRALPYNLK